MLYTFLSFRLIKIISQIKYLDKCRWTFFFFFSFFFVLTTHIFFLYIGLFIFIESIDLFFFSSWRLKEME